jgi:hypothetical protein
MLAPPLLLNAVMKQHSLETSLLVENIHWPEDICFDNAFASIETEPELD